MKRKMNKGFTLAELLIVVAIIAVLVAISIPIFSNQIKKARLATNQANARAAYAAWVAQYIDEGMPFRKGSVYYIYDTTTGKISSYTWSARNFGAEVCNSNMDQPITDISAWKTTTRANKPERNLGSNVYKYWQIRVTDGELSAYYAYLYPSGDY
ncbi:MAG: prepilin-type N-terminal cleavage/methylation domain-containing protein [Lachnospiraceae bacterium]|jgi:prepilin-type N-terminal cleavage/methylation domain-containing protein|nr:prepilin-type N-terminal cleavage/methylation domain-containing protein [Lachnospiraceae bacterium]MCH4027300.1 prepilin-type N-terminal cleavage/methylation domain-containing protein [Lachnospiraceae bacterium]